MTKIKASAINKSLYFILLNISLFHGNKLIIPCPEAYLLRMLKGLLPEDVGIISGF